MDTASFVLNKDLNVRGETLSENIRAILQAREYD
jgi:hypothetical protein